MADVNIDTLANDIHSVAVANGFWEPLKRMTENDDFIFYAKQLMMIDTEVTETLEAMRKMKGEETIVEEIADIIIRTLDLYAGLYENKAVQLSLHDILMRKVEYNKTRGYLHGVIG